jgi:regulator of replication initiation timing
VKTLPIGWVVSRRFGDFVDLKKQLNLEFPGFFVPPLPKKARTDPSTLPTFLLHLSRFIQTVVRTPIFLCSPVLKSFLADGRSLFESTIKSARKASKPASVDQMWSISGSIVCQTAPLSPAKLTDYFTNCETLKRTITHQFGFVSAVLNSLSGQLQQLANSLRSLSELQASVPEAYRQLDIYGNLSEVMEEWSRKEAENSSLMDLYGQALFKAEKREAEECKQMLKERDTLEAIWTKATDHLNDKKERLWAQGDPVKWEISPTYPGDIPTLKANKSAAFPYMLHRETQDSQRSKQKLDFLNYKLRTEMFHVLELSATAAAVRLSELGRLWDENKQDLVLKWRELLGRLSAFY